jgi:hypothetical protein
MRPVDVHEVAGQQPPWLIRQQRTPVFERIAEAARVQEQHHSRDSEGPAFSGGKWEAAHVAFL